MKTNNLALEDLARIYWIKDEMKRTGKAAEELFDSRSLHEKYHLYGPVGERTEDINKIHLEYLNNASQEELQKEIDQGILAASIARLGKNEIPDIKAHNTDGEVLIIGILNHPLIIKQLASQSKKMICIIDKWEEASFLRVYFRDINNLEFKIIDSDFNNLCKGKDIYAIEFRNPYLPSRLPRPGHNRTLSKEEEEKFVRLIKDIEKNPGHKSRTYVISKNLLSRVSSAIKPSELSNIKLGEVFITFRYVSTFSDLTEIEFESEKKELFVKEITPSAIHALEIILKKQITSKERPILDKTIMIRECFDVKSNISLPSNKNKEDEKIGANIFYLENSDQSRIIDFSKEKEGAFLKEETIYFKMKDKMKTLEDGDILVSRFFTRNTLRVFLIKNPIPNSFIPNNFTVIRSFKENIIKPDYLYAILTSPVIEQLNGALFKNEKNRTQPLLSIKELSALDIPLISIQEQEKYLSKIQEAEDVVLRANQEREKIIREANELIGIKL